jgi:UDP-glucose 4-epimerase
VVNCIVEGVHGSQTGIFNLAGDGVMTLREMADRLGKPYLPVSPSLLERALTVLGRRGLTRYGPEQMRFLQYRPVLSNERLKREFGYRPQKTTREVFDLYAESRRRGEGQRPREHAVGVIANTARALVRRLTGWRREVGGGES